MSLCMALSKIRKKSLKLWSTYPKYNSDFCIVQCSVSCIIQNLPYFLTYNPQFLHQTSKLGEGNESYRCFLTERSIYM